VPVVAFRFARGGPRADSSPQPLGADTGALLGDLGLTRDEIAVLRRDHVV
jgi:crotonobetainyl-CoA:carnitine CoA-transferase CaiB-like acyl-CoA transferase